MRCREAQRLFDAFLDSELSTETNLEITDHIAACEECRLRIEGEERVRNKFAEALRRTSESEDRAFSAALAVALNDPRMSRRGRFRPSRWTVGRGIAGVAVAASILFLLLPSGRGGDLAKRAVENHRHMMEEAGTAPLAAEEIADSVASLSRDIGLRIASAPFLSGDVSVYLAQHCRLGDVPVAYFLVEEGGGASVSFFLFPETEMKNFSGEARRLASPGGRYETFVGGYRFCAVSTGGGVACVVSESDEYPGAELAASLLRSP